MPVQTAAKLKDFAAFEAEYAPGDEQQRFNGVPLLFDALANNRVQARYEISSFLLDRGALVAGTDSEGNTALAILLSRQDHDVEQTLELTRRLVEAGVDPAQPNAKGTTPSHWIAQLGVPDEQLAPLLDYWFSLPGLDLDARSSAGKSPIEFLESFPRRADRLARMRGYRA